MTTIDSNELYEVLARNTCGTEHYACGKALFFMFTLLQVVGVFNITVLLIKF